MPAFLSNERPSAHRAASVGWSHRAKRLSWIWPQGFLVRKQRLRHKAHIRNVPRPAAWPLSHRWPHGSSHAARTAATSPDTRFTDFVLFFAISLQINDR